MAGFIDWLFPPFENKTAVITTTDIALPVRTTEAIRADLASATWGGDVDAFQVATFAACARVLAEDLAKVPAIIQRRSTNGGHDLATDHPLFACFATAPNDFQSSFEQREWAGYQLALEGNAFVYVVRDTKGRAVELLPLPAGSVEISNPRFGEVAYKISGVSTRYDNSNIWHIRAASRDGFRGDSPRLRAARALALSTAMEAFGMNLFLNGARPSGILSTEQSLKPEEYDRLINAWNARNSGVDNAHKTALLSNGLSFQSMQTAANDAQFTESRRYQTEDICRIMRVDPIMIQQTTNTAAYASVEQRFLAHAQNTLEPLFVRYEQSANRVLFTKEEIAQGYRLHLDRRALTRGSANDRAQYYASMKQNGLMTTNEIRDAEGLDRINDPLADTLQPSANLYGDKSEPQTK